MHHRSRQAFILGCAALVATPLVTSAAPRAGERGGERAIVAQRMLSLTRETTWTLADKVPVAFTTHHPQGMVEIGGVFYVSSVEVRVPPKRRPRHRKARAPRREQGIAAILSLGARRLGPREKCGDLA
jgi:hypothetical protein